MSNQSALYKVCDKSKCVDIATDFVDKLSNPSYNNANNKETSYEKNISGTYKDKGNANKKCTEPNGSSPPYCHFLTDDKRDAAQWRADYMNLTNSSGNGNKSSLSGCPGSTSELPNYNIASWIFREKSGADDVYKLCKREVFDDNKDNCCLNNDTNTAEKCPDGVYYGSNTCNDWRKSEILNVCKMDKKSNIVNLSSGSKCNKLRSANPIDFRNMADAQCIENRSLDNWTQCMQHYGENDYLKNVAINYCTNLDRLFNTTCLSQNGKAVSDPGFLASAKKNEIGKYCVANPGLPNCENFIKNYDLYGSTLINYCKGSDNSYSNVANTNACKTIFTDYVNRNDIQVSTKNYITIEKNKYCNNKNRFDNAICLDTIKQTPILFDNVISDKCLNSTSEYCNTLNSNKLLPETSIRQFNKCINIDGSFNLDDVKCMSRLNDTDPRNRLDHTLNYCKKGNNAIDKPICQDILNKTTVKSGFVAERSADSTSWDYCIIIIFILLSIIIYSRSYNKDNNVKYCNIFKR